MAISVTSCIRSVQVDDNKEVKKIYHHALDAIASIIKLLESSDILDSLMDNAFDIRLPLELGTLTKLPGIGIPKISLLNLLQNNELPTLAEFYYTYRYFKPLSPHLTSHRFVRASHEFAYDLLMTFNGTKHYMTFIVHRSLILPFRIGPRCYLPT